MNKTEIKVLKKSLKKGNIQNYKETDKGCTFEIPTKMDKNTKKLIEMMQNYKPPFENMVFESSINKDDLKTENGKRLFIEEMVDLHNEFAECGDDLVFVDDLYIEPLNVSHGKFQNVCICKRKDQRTKDSVIKNNLKHIMYIIEKDNILYRHIQVFKRKDLNKPIDISNIITAPKETALLFEAYKRRHNLYKNIGYDDLRFNFEMVGGVEYLIVRFKPEFIERVKSLSER